MEKQITFKLQAKDVKLIAELEKNSRASMTEIAKKIGVSKEVANYRLKRLVDAGFIKGFRLIADYSTMGFQLYRIMLNLSNIQEGTKEDIIQYIKHAEAASFNALLQSVWDMEIIVLAKNTMEFHEFYDAFIEKYSDFIHDKDFSLITRTHFLGHPYLHGARMPLVVGQQKPEKFDMGDYQIIEILSKNSRTSVKEISEKTGMPSSTIIYKIRSMAERGVIKGFRPILNCAMLGYARYKVEVILNNPAGRKAIIQYLIMMPSVTKIVELIGKFDLEFHADFRNPMELEKFLMELRTKFRYVKDYDVIPIVRDEIIQIL